MTDVENSKKAQEAIALFKDGKTCTQAVLLPFCKELGLDEKTALAIASSFGGGMGRMREVCGTVSGMFMVAGLKFGYFDPADLSKRGEHYALIRQMADQFKELNGSIICRELLGLKEKYETSPVPEKRTDEYYKKRPCAKLVGQAAAIAEEFIKKGESNCPT